MIWFRDVWGSSGMMKDALNQKSETTGQDQEKVDRRTQPEFLDTWG